MPLESPQLVTRTVTEVREGCGVKAMQSAQKSLFDARGNSPCRTVEEKDDERLDSLPRRPRLALLWDRPQGGRCRECGHQHYPLEQSGPGSPTSMKCQVRRHARGRGARYSEDRLLDRRLQAGDVDRFGQVSGETGSRLCRKSSSEPNPLMAIPGTPRVVSSRISSRPVPSGSSTSLISRSNSRAASSARASERLAAVRTSCPLRLRIRARNWPCPGYPPAQQPQAGTTSPAWVLVRARSGEGTGRVSSRRKVDPRPRPRL